MTISVVIPVHGCENRRELAKRVLLYYETLEVEGIDIVAVPVFDVDESPLEEQIFGIPGPVACVDIGTPLGAKFNCGIAYYKGMEVIDGVMIVGSDDLVAPEVFERIRDDQPDYQEIRGVHFYNAATKNMILAWRSHCGAGKYFSKAFLDDCDWNPYEAELDHNVDRGPNRFIKKHHKRGVVQAAHDHALCIDIKNFGANMTPWEIVERYPLTDLNKAAAFQSVGEKEEWWCL